MANHSGLLTNSSAAGGLSVYSLPTTADTISNSAFLVQPSYTS